MLNSISELCGSEQQMAKQNNDKCFFQKELITLNFQLYLLVLLTLVFSAAKRHLTMT